jgi:ABC-2 type transport system permease protein
MLRIALRAHRRGFLAVTVMAAIIGLAQAAGFAAAAGRTEASRASFGHQMEVLAPQLSYLLPLPVHLETIGGYIQWRVYGFLPLVFGLWAVLAAVGAIRGEEERGLLEEWLAAGADRTRWIAVRFVAFVVVSLTSALVTALAILLGALGSGFSLEAAGLLTASLVLVALSLACFGLGLLVAQFFSGWRNAAGAGSAVLVVLFFLDSLGRSSRSIADYRGVSPFYLYDRTTALAPGGHFDVPATVALVAIAVALTVLAASAFARRDLNASLLGRRAVASHPVREPSRNPMLRLPVLRTLYEQRLGLLAWIAGAAVLALVLLSVSRASADLLASNPNFRAYLAGQGSADLGLVVLGLFWFGLASLVVAGYAITQVAHWAADDAEGRLEMVLAQPVSRWQVVVERALALTLGVALLAAAGSSLIAIGAPGQGISVDPGRLLLATALLLPVALTFGAIGAAVTSGLPRLAVPLLTAVAAGGYLIQQLGPLFKWPQWTIDLSVFQLYGAPLTQGVFWNGLYAMLAVVVAGFGIALVAVRYRDVGR